MFNTPTRKLVPSVLFTIKNENNNSVSFSSLDTINHSTIFSSQDLLNFTIDNDLENLNSDDKTQIYNQNTLIFATHNVHSLQDDVKNSKILETFYNKNANFVALTETWHKSSQSLRCSSDPNFDTIWSSVSGPFLGVGFLISKH